MFNGGFNREIHKAMAKYETSLNSLGISFHWEIDRDTKKLNYRDLTGPEKVLVFQKIDILEILSGTEEKHKIKLIWNHFIDLIAKLKLSYSTDEEITAFTTDIKEWVKEFNHVYETRDVTPYMHALHSHIPEFLRLYENVAVLNQQGLEKYNDQCSKDYFRSSNHQGIAALRQLLLKRNRVQFLKAAGAERVKASYTYSNCNNTGHSIKKCTAECSHCPALTCCAHLVKVDGKWYKSCTL